MCAVDAGMIEAFGMRDAAARDHPVDFAGADFLRVGEAVAMRDRPVVKIGYGGKADMRMRPDIQFARQAGREIYRPEMVEEYIRPHNQLRVKRMVGPYIFFDHQSEEHTSELQSPV